MMTNKEALRDRLSYCLLNKSSILNISSLGLTELPKELVEFTWLNQLYCYNNKIVDLNRLAGLIKLEVLCCRSNKIRDISPLARLINLSKLDCRDNQIVDISPLAKLTNCQMEI